MADSPGKLLAIDPATGLPAASPDQPPKLDPVPQAVLDLALHQIRAIMRGNGASAESVTIKSHQGEVLDFEAYEIFRITSKASEKYVNGKQAGKVITSETELRHEINRAIDMAAQDPAANAAVREALRQRPDLGFGLDRQVIPLPGAAVQYVVHSQCTSCHGTKAAPCSGCQGRGRQLCTRCRGKREISCPGCRGNRTIMQGGNQVQCNQCRGRGLIGCTLCQRTGQMQCVQCRGNGRMPCDACGSTGWRTLVASLSFSAEGHFDYDRAALPDGIPAQIDRVKAVMVTDKHADVRLIADTHRLAELEKMAHPGDMIVPYRVRLPHGRIMFAIRGMKLEGTFFGQKPVISKLPPFLEKTAGKGLRLLAQAAQTRGDIAGLLENAVRTRLIADIVVVTASKPPMKAVAILRKRYPHGIRPHTLTAMVRHAETCLRNLTRFPRMVGFGIGVALCAVIDATYLFSPLRTGIAAQAGPYAAAGADMLVLLSGIGIGTAAVQICCVRAIRKVLGQIRTGKDLHPKTGQSIAYGGFGGLLAFAAVIAVAVMTGHAPSWAILLLRG